MPYFERDGISLYYELHGEGFPVLLFAPGGMRSAIAVWQRGAYDPMQRLSDEFQLIAMDQRNAGQSRAPVRKGDGWQVYTEDHLALLDHLGVERCAVLGNCIGGSFGLGLIQAAPERVAAAVLQQPIGLTTENRKLFFDMFDAWAKDLGERPDVDQDALAGFRQAMYGGDDFVFNVSKDFVKTVQTPLLITLGNDPYHPSETSRAIAALAPNAQLLERWKEPELVDDTVAKVRAFLREHAAL
ncbi:MAG: alpha/beta hydrolase [Myxococcales bacterium]|nr:alpha/beta hydrolase [Myxococcales bacterium]